ncbi:hypothetical protein V8J88_24390 [Massilia sp. W12]|uniref:hypothetical protein n=1 Tax=Massilia sp. W12 TaxID=3126507 RepID=UPI0030CD41BB
MLWIVLAALVFFALAFFLMPYLPGARAYRDRQTRIKTYLRQESAIKQWRAPALARQYVQKLWPNCQTPHLDMMENLLRQFFMCNLQAESATLAIPSFALQHFWQGVILCGKAYAEFTGQAEHIADYRPLDAREYDPQAMQQNLLLCWQMACLQEGLDWRQPARLPALFGLDQKLGISNGWRYVCSNGYLQVWRAEVREWHILLPDRPPRLRKKD